MSGRQRRLWVIFAPGIARCRRSVCLRQRKDQVKRRSLMGETYFDLTGMRPIASCATIPRDGLTFAIDRNTADPAAAGPFWQA
jgi:hypothetical protein